MKLLRQDDYRVQRWKNGLGTTREILSADDSGGQFPFLWRVSLATLSASGPFSAFPGIARCFALVAGGPVRLKIDQGAPVSAHAGGPALHFDGGARVEAVVEGGDATALNVMCRTGVGLRASLAVLTMDPVQSLTLEPMTEAAVARLLLSPTGGRVSVASGQATMGAWDCCVFGPDARQTCRLDLMASEVLYCVDVVRE